MRIVLLRKIYNMVIINKMSRKDTVKMYMKSSKAELIDMLLENQRLLRDSVGETPFTNHSMWLDFSETTTKI
jgi:hypothetical protein